MRLLLLALGLLAGNLGWALDARADDWTISSGSAITLYVDHAMHDVVAVSRSPRGTLSWSPASPTDFTQLAGKYIQADWTSFDSDNASRDENIRTYVNARKFPTLTLKVTGVRDALQDAQGTVRVTVDALLYCNGQKHAVSAPARISQATNGQVQVYARFEARMTDFGIEPPSLMFVQAKDAFRVETSLTLLPAAAKP